VRLTVPAVAVSTVQGQIEAAPAAPVRRAAPIRLEAPAPAAQTVEPTSPSAPGAPASELWPKVLVLIKAQNNSLSALLQMYPVEFATGEIIVKPRFNFHRDLFLKPANRTAIEVAAAKVYGRAVKLSARTEDGGKPVKRVGPDPAAELVSSALEILGGEVVD